jgi:polysaccharide pyruvyl transferase WcaK-like protein
MMIDKFLKTTDLNSSLLLGYYGGGNFGDELLLEVLQNLLKYQGVQALTVAYQNPQNFSQLHHDFGYNLVDIQSKSALIKQTVKHKNIIVGGGGLWGLDMNLNTFLMSVYLFLARWLLGKKIYLIGVGYYNSTTRLGHLGAFLAAKAARRIIVRDAESYANFKKHSSHVEQDTDLAFYSQQIDLSTYGKDAKQLEKLISVQDKTVFIAIRRFQAKHQNSFNKQIEDILAANPDKHFILALLELKSVDQTSYQQLSIWKQKFQNVQVLDSTFNPLALMAFFKKHHKKLAVIAPQFHLILTAHLANVPFMPVVYDNKVSQLLSSLGISKKRQIAINQLSSSDIQNFIYQFDKE